MPEAVLPSLADLRALLGVGAASLLLTLCGRAVLGQRTPTELCLLAGWGVLCCLCTLWAVAIPFSLYGVLAVIGLLAVFGAIRRPAASDGAWRLAVLMIPLWLVLAASRPAQIDTWFNLLPNLAYLADHGRLPTADGPLSYSFLPVAPYNTQFAAFLASALSGGLAANAMGLFNVVLQGAAALLLARMLGGQSGQLRALPPWWACALGLLLAMPLNPGFLPKVFVSGYGEAPLAVTTLFAVWLAGLLFQAARAQAPLRGLVTALALVLAALVNIKQSSIGLVLPLLATMFFLGLLCPDMGRRRWVFLTASTGLPALALFGLWRWYVAHDFPGGELTVLPVSHWNLRMLPGILGAILAAWVKAPVYAAAVLAMLAGFAREARRRPWQPAAITLALVTGTALLFNVFLVFTYVSHFPADWAADAHSYRRYLSQLSLCVVLGLCVWLRPWVASRLGRSPRVRLRAGWLAVGVAMLWPFALTRLLRADLATPQPLVWDMARKSASFLAPNDRLGLVLPGDNDDALGSMLRGVLLFTPPGRAALDVSVERIADPAALAELAARGVTKALVSCAPPGGLAGLPADVAAFVELRDGAWRPLAVWPYPAHFNDRPFAAWLPHAPLCGHDAFSRAQLAHACRAAYPPRISALPAPARRPGCVRPASVSGPTPPGGKAAP